MATTGIWTSDMRFLVAVSVVIAYLALVRALRFRRESLSKKRFGYYHRDTMRQMTTSQAQQIIQTLSHYEFPRFLQLSLEFGLFKTYGVESISKLLGATGNLTAAQSSPRRFEDTAILIDEFSSHPPGSERSVCAIARINFLHAKYRKQGLISNDDLLYTLSVFLTEPIRFVRLYEWRAMNEMEYCAYGVFWKDIGDLMDIDYHGSLPGGETGWKDGVQFADELTAWAKAYEIKAMKPSLANAKPAEALIPLMLYWVPWFGRSFATECLCALMGDRVREAFMLPEPGVIAFITAYTAIAVRRFVFRHLMLPRFFQARPLMDQDSRTGRFTVNFARGNYPFYVTPSFWSRWGPIAWAIWTCGGKLPGDEPDVYKPQGYTFQEIGPLSRENQGSEEMAKSCEQLMSRGRDKIPF